MESQQRYLQDVPTLGEHTKGQKVNRDLQEETHSLRAHIALLEKKVQDTNKGRHSRDGLIESMERSEKELKERLRSVEVGAVGEVSCCGYVIVAETECFA